MALGIGTSINTGLFGKTPMYADFIRVNAGSPAARAWDEWLNRSLAEMRRLEGEDWEVIFDAAAPLQFVGRPSHDHRQILAGHIHPSRDASGRRFPLTIFCELQLDRLGRGIQVLPFALKRFLESAAEVARGASERDLDSSAIRSMSSLVPENPVELGRAMADHLREITMESFWSGLFGSTDDPRKYLSIKNIFGILAPLRGYDPQRLSMGLRFPGTPLESPIPPGLSMATWASLSRAVIGDESMSASWIFWRSASAIQRPGCFLFFRTPTPGALTTMLDPGHAMDTIWDVETLGNDRIVEARDALGPAITGVLDSPRLPLLEFIQRV